jgi:hypothetical protein
MKAALSINKTYHHGITEILLKVALNTNKTDHHDITDIVESDIKNP